MSPIAWRAEDLVPVVLLSIATVFYPISYYVPRAFRPLLVRRGISGRTLEISVVVLDRLFGTLALGLPALWALVALLPPRANRYGFNLENAWLSLGVTAVSCAVVWAALVWAARYWPPGLKGYPQMRVRCWDTQLLTVNAVTWIVYLLAYELLFRAVLLYPLADAYGGWAAVMITTGLYSFTHLVKEAHEEFVTIMVGVLFGVLALVTDSILAPVLIHCFTAVFNDYAAIPTVPGAVIRDRCPERAE